ncbi:glycosyl hydrolase [Rhodotorula diobovata]|uniref:Endo-1,5-alpha-L-arabinanase A n=1 Tax=Rhodotorula diobovata TaxID=5288 RepID=A0A5C5FT95_9BASI|nr:glycosyl hydrolase [Rhodotorula diobovata]
MRKSVREQVSSDLVWGSCWQGIFLGDIDPETGLLASTTYTNLAARPGAGVIEAPWLFERNGVFYLFTSWDQCCEGTKSTYHIRVATSRSLAGPYFDASGKPALEGHMTLLMDSHDDVYGPGGQSLLEDVDGVVLVFHRYFGTGSTGLLSLNMLEF